MTPSEKHSLALLLFRTGQAAESLVLLREIIGEHESSEIWNDWAGIQHSLGHAEEAEKGFRIALELNPENTQAALNLGVFLAAQGRHREARKYLDLCRTSKNPLERANAQQILLETSLTISEWDEPGRIETYLRRFLSSDPNERSYFETHVRRYVETLLHLPAGNGNMRILELGAAFHHLTSALLCCKRYGDVRCSDIWIGEAQKARRISPVDGDEEFSFLVDNFDIQESPWPYENGAFDAVLCSEILEHLHTDPMGLFAEINRVLKQDGILLLTTPNLASAHAVFQTTFGASPYAYGKFELAGKPTDRHNREYTANEVERLALAAGFGSLDLRTHDFYWPGKHETFRSLAVHGHPIARRGDSTFLLARKQSHVKDRYPEEFYASVGVQGARREHQSSKTVLTQTEILEADIPQNILFVHELLPHYDCSGADLRLYELLRELRAANHGVTLLARDDRDEAHYRPVFESLGITVHAGDPERLRHTGNDNSPSWGLHDVLKKGNFDLAILSHWFWCGISVAEHYLEEIRQHSSKTKILVLSEDRHGERERRSAALTGFLSDIERGNNFEQREMEIYARADLVLYVTETDQRHFLELLPNLATEHLPTIAEAGPHGPDYSEREGVLFLGNFENLANRDALEWMLEKVWPLVRKEEPELQLYIAGHAAPEGLEARYSGIKCVGKVDEMGPLFAQKRVFAAPIRYGTGIITKNMHALAHGLPVVTTTVGAEGMQLQHEAHALIADDPRQFATAILRLYRDATLWRKISADGRNYIRSKFCIENLRSQIRKIITRATRMQPKAFEPGYIWSYREVESVFPEVLTQEPSGYRPMLRTLRYWQLGRRHLDAGRPAEALQQFRHIFTFVRGRLPSSAFHSVLLDDMARAYRELGDAKSAAHCEKEKRHCVWAWKTKAPDEFRNGKQKRDGEKLPEISVILPTYNRKEILRVCLASLAFQSLPAHRWEVVVVDDGSADDTDTLCKEMLFPFRLTYFRQENQGAGAARRKGVEAARGEFLLLCNDDTIASSNLLVEHLSVHRTNPREKWAVLGEFRYSESVGKRALSLFVNTSVFFFPQSALKPGELYDQAHFVTCNLSVRRDAVLGAGNFDPRFRVAEDTELGTRMIQRGFRVFYHPAAMAWHEHAQFTTRDLICRAQAYGAADWALFAKHPQLLGDGSGPFGKLATADETRIRAILNQYRPAVNDAVIALAAMDEFDFRLLLKDKETGHAAAEQLMRQIGQVVPMVYWHHLFERFLERWDETHASREHAALVHDEHWQTQPTGAR